MSNSALVKHTNISPNKTSPRNNSIQKLQFIIWLEICQLKVVDKFFKIRVQGPVATTGLEQMVVLECMLNISQLCLDQIQTGGKIN